MASIKKKQNPFMLFLTIHIGELIILGGIIVLLILMWINYEIFHDNSLQYSDNLIRCFILALVEICVPIFICVLGGLLVRYIQYICRLSTLPLTEEELKVLGITTMAGLLNYIDHGEPLDNTFNGNNYNRAVPYESLDSEYIDMVFSLAKKEDIPYAEASKTGIALRLLVGLTNYETYMTNMMKSKKEEAKVNEVRKREC